MRPIRLDRVYKQANSASQMLGYAQREAELMVDQTLADDLLAIHLRLQEVLRAAERKRYRSPLQRAA